MGQVVKAAGDILSRDNGHRVNIMMDSGAFSAWSSGITINIDDYIAYLKENMPSFYSAVCLDTIPGESGSMARVTQRMLEESANKSFENYLKMRKAGLDVIPVFHQGEDFAHLERLVDERVPYIGISPYMRAKPDSMMAWFDECFTRITDKDGVPLVKTHGFGVTSNRATRRYPWFTLDSTSWIMQAAYGSVYLPVIDGNKERFDLPPIAFSATDRDKVSDASKALHMLGPYSKKMVEQYLAKLHLDIHSVRISQFARSDVNLAYFMGVQATLGVKPFEYRRRGHKARHISTAVVPFEFSPEYFFATTMRSTWQVAALNRRGIRNRLINFFDVGGRTGAELLDRCAKAFFACKDQREWTADYRVYKTVNLKARYPNNEYVFNGVVE